MNRLPAGMRTFAFGIVALCFLLAGLLAALKAAQGEGPFSTFAAAVAFIVSAVAGKHATESLATGGGIAGAWKALTTESKPPPPKEPAE